MNLSSDSTESFKKPIRGYGDMIEKEVKHASGLSFLTDKQLIELEGQCVAIVDGKVAYNHTNPERVLSEMKKIKGKEKIFTCVPDSKITLVK